MRLPLYDCNAVYEGATKTIVDKLQLQRVLSAAAHVGRSLVVV